MHYSFLGQQYRVQSQQTLIKAFFSYIFLLLSGGRDSRIRKHGTNQSLFISGLAQLRTFVALASNDNSRMQRPSPPPTDATERWNTAQRKTGTTGGKTCTCAALRAITTATQPARRCTVFVSFSWPRFRFERVRGGGASEPRETSSTSVRQRAVTENFLCCTVM